MKKRVFIVLITAVVFFCAAAFGEQAAVRVFDYAGLFSAEEAQTMEAAIAEFQESLGYDFIILTSNEDHGYDDYQQLCDDFYTSQSLGLGMNGTAVICYLDFYGDGYSYQYYVSVYGDLINLMGEEDISILTNKGVEYFNEAEFVEGFLWTIELFSKALPHIATAYPNTRVYDFAELLYDDEIEAIEAAIAEFRALTGYDFLYLSTYQDMEGNEDGEYMAEFYDRHGFGEGDNRSGAMIYLDLDMEALYFNYYIHNFGDINNVVSQDALYDILDTCMPFMDEGEIAQGVLKVLESYSAYIQ